MIAIQKEMKNFYFNALDNIEISFPSGGEMKYMEKTDGNVLVSVVSLTVFIHLQYSRGEKNERAILLDICGENRRKNFLTLI